MAATKVYKLGNLLVIEVDSVIVSTKNAAWYQIGNWTNDSVVLNYTMGTDSGILEIKFSDFRNHLNIPLNTKESILTYLSDKIGY